MRVRACEAVLPLRLRAPACAAVTVHSFVATVFAAAVILPPGRPDVGLLPMSIWLVRHARRAAQSPASSLWPDLPVEVWAYIMDILEEQRRRAATVIEAHFRGYKTRIGPLRWILRYIRKGRLVQTRATYAVSSGK